MKLNNKRTMLVGLAFLSICAFWQMYDTVIPKILTETFHLDEALSGAIMAADNVLALFLLPFFGALSDRTNTRLGRRMPYILAGTALAVVLMNLLPVFDNGYAAAPGATKLTMFVITLGLLLIAMGTYRSPAVALMPDVTPKPLRSKANAIINLMGTLGGICVLVLGMGFAFNNSAVANTFRPSYGFFGVVSGIMLAALAVFMLTVRERKWAAEMEAETARLEAAGEAPVEEDRSGDRKLSRGERASLLLILASVALWYFGYNAVTSKYSVYATNVLDLDYSATLLIANAAAVLSYIPVGFISSRIGRKKSILAGVAMLAVAFGAACFVRVGSSPLIMNATFALAGIGWASINVNSFPMVVELSTGGNIGRYTGYYYAASMAAQALTPFLSGLFMDHLGMTALFPYATVFVSLSFLTMLCVRHGDSKPVPKGSVLEQLDVGDD